MFLITRRKMKIVGQNKRFFVLFYFSQNDFQIFIVKHKTPILICDNPK